MNRPGWWIYVRDMIIFGFGLVLIMKQAGILFAPPPAGPNLYLIVLGGLFCNGPIVLQALSLRFGTGRPSPEPAPPVSDSPPEPSSASSSGGS